MKRGEIWQAQLPPAPGHVQAGARPVLVVQNDQHIASLPTVLVVPFTGASRAQRFPGTMVIPPDGQNGLSMASVALAFQLRALDQRDLLQQIGRIDQKQLDQILVLIDSLIK